ncbi:GMC oxidoreductase [Humibacter soli]
MGDSVEYADAVIVGSGFGASVAAYRLADAGKSVVLMERGRPYPPGSFARTPAEFGRNFWDPSEGLFGLFDTWTFRGLEGLVSSGLGGGSLIYANVLLRKDPAWFVKYSPLPGGGYENWAFGRDDLDPHYDRVEAMMGATRYPYHDTPKTEAVESAARAAGLSAERPPLAVTFALPGHDAQPGRELPLAAYGNLHHATRLTCTLCGECDIGCNSGAKNTLDHTYLSAAVAAHTPADVRTLHEVRGIRRLDDGAWEVRYVIHDPGEAVATRHLDERVIRASKVILGAGTFGTTYLLLRNRAGLPGLSDAIGTRFSGNGDLLAFLLDATKAVAGEKQPYPMNGSRGPVITTAVRVADELDGDGAPGRGHYVEDAGFPGFIDWLMEVSQLRQAVPRFARLAARIVENRLFAEGRTNLSSDLAAALGSGVFSETSVPLLGMGRDVPDGVMSIHDDNLAVDWTLATSEKYFAGVHDTMRALAEQMGADFQDNPLWWAKRVITVHPLGGAPIGANDREGVCDPYSEVYNQPGLYVVDGAAMPGPVGANPSLTIAALSDRACDRMLETAWNAPNARTRGAKGRATSSKAAATGAASAAEAPTAAPPEAPTVPTPGSTSVAFTEEMKGHFTLGDGDPRSAAATARLRHEDMMFHLTITATDIDAFTADPVHPGTAVGYLDADLLGGRLVVERGWFNLFVHPTGDSGRRMLYRLHVTGEGGNPMTFVGYKDVHDDPGFDVWGDTTTLYVQVLSGHLDPDIPQETADLTGLLAASDNRVLGAGVLHIEPLDFARQLTTFTTSGPLGFAAIERFGGLFLGELWSTYAGIAHARR